MAKSSKKPDNKQTSLQKKSVKTADEEVISPDIFEQMPAPMREVVESMIVSGPVPNPIANKLTPEHIDKIIDQSGNDTALLYKDKTEKRKFTLVYVFIAVLAFFVLSWMFAKDEPELFKDILSHLGVAIAGFAAGWGFTAIQNKEN